MINKKDLHSWCSIPLGDLENHKGLKVRFRLVESSEEMGHLMAREFIDEIIKANNENRTFRAIVPCGPKSWYEPFTNIVNAEKVSLKNVVVFHMDECLDWEGNFGGASASGGIGTIPGAIIGALVMGIMNNGMSIMGLGVDWQQAIKGLVVILAVAFDVVSKNRGK